MSYSDKVLDKHEVEDLGENTFLSDRVVTAKELKYLPKLDQREEDEVEIKSVLTAIKNLFSNRKR